MFSSSKLRGQPKLRVLKRAGERWLLLSCLFQAFGSIPSGEALTKAPVLSPGCWWLLSRAMSRAAALTLLCSTTAPLSLPFADNFRGPQFLMVYSGPSVILLLLLMMPFLCRPSAARGWRAVGAWLRGVPSAHKGDRQSRERLLLVLWRLFYLLANEVAQKRECEEGKGTEPETEQRMGIMYFSIDICPTLLKGKGGS